MREIMCETSMASASNAYVTHYMRLPVLYPAAAHHQVGLFWLQHLLIVPPSLPSPEKVRPVTPRLSSMGMDTDRWFQSAVLSPVQIGPTVWVPVLDYMKKRSS